MKKLIRFTIYSSLVILVVYAFFSFVALEYNPLLWDDYVRLFFAIFVFVLICGVLIHVYDGENHSSDFGPL